MQIDTKSRTAIEDVINRRAAIASMQSGIVSLSANETVKTFGMIKSSMR